MVPDGLGPRECSAVAWDTNVLQAIYADVKAQTDSYVVALSMQVSFVQPD